MIKTLQQAPFLRLSLFYIAGIVFGSLTDVPVFGWLGILLFSLLLILFSFFCRSYPFRWLFGAGCLAFFFSLGSLTLGKENHKTDWTYDGWQEYDLEIVDAPVRKPKTWMCLSQTEEKKVILYISADSLSALLLPGDSLRIRANLQKPEADYWRKKGIAAQGFVPSGSWVKTGRRQSFDLFYQSLRVRHKLLELLRAIVPDNEMYMDQRIFLVDSSFPHIKNIA